MASQSQTMSQILLTANDRRTLSRNMSDSYMSRQSGRSQALSRYTTQEYSPRVERDRYMEEALAEATITSTEIPDPVPHRYAHLHNTLYFSIFITAVGSFAIFIPAILVRHYTLEFVDFFLREKMAGIIKDIEIEANTTWEELGHPDVIMGAGFDRYPSHERYFGRWPRLLTDLCFTNVMLMWASCIAGTICIYDKSKAVVVAFIVMNIATIITEMYTAWVLTSTDDKLHEGLSIDMANVIRQMYIFHSKSLIRKVFNTVMIVGRCCGVRGPYDFGDRLIKFESTTSIQQIPQACCRPEWWTIFDTQRPFELVCVTRGAMENNDRIYEKGCYDVYSQYFVKETRIYIYAFSTLVCIEQVVQILIGIVIIRWTTFVDHQCIIEQGILALHPKQKSVSTV